MAIATPQHQPNTRYDIGVSGGVTTSPNFLQTFFPDVYVQQQQDAVNSVYCQFDSATLQLFTSSLYLAGELVVGGGCCL